MIGASLPSCRRSNEIGCSAVTDNEADAVKPSLSAKRTLGQVVAGGGALAAAVAMGEGVDGYLWSFVIIHAALIVGAVWLLVCAWKEIARAESLRFGVATYILADAVVVVGLYGVALSGSRVAVVLIIAIYCLWLGVRVGKHVRRYGWRR